MASPMTMRSTTVFQSTRPLPAHAFANRSGPVFRPHPKHMKLSIRETATLSTPLRVNVTARASSPTTDARSDDRAADSKPAEVKGRKIVFAVDGTAGAEEGLRWLVKQIARKGDTVHLAHVIADPRTPSTAVGSSTAGSQWSPARDEQVYAREFFLRVEHEANSMMASRFIPSLQFTGVEHKVDLLRLRLHKSAASIGETLSNHAATIGADLLVIASHGAGVLANYGSVARWCSQHSTVPTLLLPPAVLQPAPAVSMTSNNILVAAADDLEGLREAFQFAVREFTRPGDNVYVVHAQQIADEEAGIAARKTLVNKVMQWQGESEVGHADTLNVAVDLVTDAFYAEADSSSDSSSASDGEFSANNSPAAARLCAFADDLNARAVVLQHYGRSMMREMMYGPVTLSCTKLCTRPLVVVGGAKR